MHYRNTITGADIYVNSEISAPNYVRIDGAEALPQKEVPKDPAKEEIKKTEPTKNAVTKKTTPKKPTKRAKK